MTALTNLLWTDSFSASRCCRRVELAINNPCPVQGTLHAQARIFRCDTGGWEASAIQSDCNPKNTSHTIDII